MTTGNDITIGGISRIQSAPIHDAAEAELLPGQSVAARVIKMIAAGEVLLGFGTSRTVLSTTTPLQPGDRVMLEVVAGGLKPEFRLATDAAAGPPLVAGERMAARVLEVMSHGDALFEFGANRAVVRTSDAVQPGDRVLLEVVAGGAKPEFQVVTGSATLAGAPATGAILSAPVLELLSHGEAPAAPAPGRTVDPTSTPLVGFGQSGAVVAALDAVHSGDRVVLEVVTGGAKPEIRVVTDNPSASAQSAAGQAAAHVLATLPNGDVLLELGANRAVVHTVDPHPGDRVVLEVVTDGLQPGLRVVTDDTAARPQPAATDPAALAARGLTPLDPRDVPLVVRALTEVPAAAILPAAVVPTSVVIAAATPDVLLSAAVPEPQPVDQLPRPLTPLEASMPPATLAVMIGTLFSQTAPFSEHHLRVMNHSMRTPPVDHIQAIPDVLLTEEMATEGHQASDAGRAFSEALLQEQLNVAERLAANGGGHLTVPFTFGEKQIDVVFEWERPARRGDQEGPDRAVTLGVFVNLKALGAIEARVDWQPASLAVNFFVEREATRAIVEAGLDGFLKQLALSGAPAITSNVFLNPGRLANASPPAPRPVDGGKLLDVMA